jgi:drug/metabolite transporter (DMT)-like permease
MEDPRQAAVTRQGEALRPYLYLAGIILIVASAPIFVAIMAGMFLSERLNRRAWLGILISFAGVGVISFAAEDGFQLSPSAILVLVAAISQALYIIIQKLYLQRYNPLQFVTYAVWLGTAFLLIFTPGLIDSMQAAPPAATLAVVYMGVFPGAIGYVCWSIVLSRMPVSKAGSFLYMVPALAIFIAWLWLGEIPSVIALGGVLVLLGVILVNTRRKSR